MSASGETGKWSLRQWTGATLAVLAVQVLLVFGLSRRGFADARASIRVVPARLAMVMGAREEDRIMAAVGGIDPALFAVAHRAGFSSRRSVTPSASAPVLAPLLEPPHWLQGGPESFGPASATSGVDNGEGIPEFMAVEKPSNDFSGLGGGAGSLARETRVRVGGALARRAILRGETAPVLASPQVVRSTVVQLGVDAEGFVQSARLLDSSDWPAANQEALKHARKILFQSVDGTNRVGVLDWGTVSFPWQIPGVSATNRIF